MENKKAEPNGNFVINPECRWCNGIGKLPVPDYSLIGELGLYDRIMNNGWSFAPMMSVYCHLCFAEGTPRKNENTPNYPTLLDAMNYAKFNQEADLELFKNCLSWHLKCYHHQAGIDKMFEELNL